MRCGNKEQLALACAGRTWSESTFTRSSVSGVLEPSPSAVGWLLWWETIMEVENSVSRRG